MINNNFDLLKKTYGNDLVPNKKLVEDIINTECSDFRLVSARQFVSGINDEMRKHYNDNKFGIKDKIDLLNNKVVLIHNQLSKRNYRNPMILYDCVNVGSAYLVGVENNKLKIVRLDGFFGCATMSMNSDEFFFIKNDFESITEVEIDDRTIDIKYYDTTAYNKIAKLGNRYPLEKSVFDIDPSILPTKELLVTNDKCKLLMDNEVKQEKQVDIDCLTYASYKDILSGELNKKIR